MQDGCYPGGVMIFVATVTPVVKTDTVESVPGGHGIGKCGGRNSRRKARKAKGESESGAALSDFYDFYKYFLFFLVNNSSLNFNIKF